MTTMPAEVPLDQLSGELLRARVARAQLYLVYGERTALSEMAAADVLLQHASYLDSLDRQGRLYGYGALERLSGDDGMELGIIAAASRDEANLIAQSDPLHQAGLRVNRVRGHTMNEGVACYVGREVSRRATAGSTSLPGGTADSSLAVRAVAESTPLYLVNLDPTAKPRSPEDTKTMDAHFVWLRENEMSAKLMSCGPVEPLSPLQPGIWGAGLGVLATTRAEAERIAGDEPSGRAGYRDLSVRRWDLQRGLAAPIAQALLRLNLLPT